MIQLGDFRHFEILVVDDQLCYRDAIGEILADLGCRNVRLVDCGLGALTEVCRRHPDVIVMDVLMPGMDGLTASTVIRDYEASQGRAHSYSVSQIGSPTGCKTTALKRAWTVASASQSIPALWRNFSDSPFR